MAYSDPLLRRTARKAGSKSVLVYEELRSAIISLKLEPGAQIDKAEICDRLEVSRQPLSEALSRLAEERLVTVEPQKGHLRHPHPHKRCRRGGLRPGGAGGRDGSANRPRHG